MTVLLPHSRRHLLGGVAAGLVIIGGFAAAHELTTEDPRDPSEWLTEADQEALAGALTGLPVDGWAAGCLWDHRDPGDIRGVVDYPEGRMQMWDWRTRSGRRASFLTAEEANVRGSYSEVWAQGAFCYVPE